MAIIKTALIGFGGMGRKYVEMIMAGKVANMSLVGVVARHDGARAHLASLVEKYPNAPKVAVYESEDAMFENASDYDAVIIVTPHKTHESIALRAFKLKKHVMCDKPAGATIGEAMRMSEASKQADCIYGMIFHQRLYPKYNKIKELLNNGEFGKLSRIMLVNSRYFRTKHYHDSGSWRSSFSGEGGGALINQGAHILDIWQWLFGMPKTVYADIPFGKYNDFEVDDEATIMMRYADDLTAVFMLTTGEAIWQERLEITGTKGKILLEDDKLCIYRYSVDSNEYIKNADTNSREGLSYEEEVIQFEKAIEPYEPMLYNFAEAVINNDPTHLIAPGSEAVNQLMLTNAAYYSAWLGENVELPIDENKYDRLLKEACQREN